MNFYYDKFICQNIQRSLTYEWLETNGLGDYASSSLINCHTRKYHGLYVANLEKFNGRYVLLNTLEESIVTPSKEFFLSIRKHPDIFFPLGHEYLNSVTYDLWTKFYYSIGALAVQKEILMPKHKSITIIKYSLNNFGEESFILRLKPLLAFRNSHKLTCENLDIQTNTKNIKDHSGYSINPYQSMPSLYMQVQENDKEAHIDYSSEGYWCKNICYLTEKERGFDYIEDLFMPRIMDVKIKQNTNYYFAVSTELITENLQELFENESKRRIENHTKVQKKIFANSELATHLGQEADKFIIENKFGLSQILAGYPWFDAWGRDSLIALPGLTFCQNKVEEGIKILDDMAKMSQNGLVPNMIALHNNQHSYNSIDASLWFIWAVQQLEILVDGHSEKIKNDYFPVIQNIIQLFRSNSIPTVFVDDEYLLHAGDSQTQLTWMDAQVFGKPVTARNGCPVEINALWYNALAYANALAKKFSKPLITSEEILRQMEHNFLKYFWVNEKNGDGYLADVYHKETNEQDKKIRPNQIFAVSLPYPILDEDFRAAVVEKVRNLLLTPMGLRTLAPSDPEYQDEYYGSGELRDSVYHQGIAWAWLLGAYGDALIRTSWDTETAVRNLLDTISPLVSKHLKEAGIGSISEIFDAKAPYKANGSIAQAWSIAEVLRLLHFMYEIEPVVYLEWEKSLNNVNE